MANSDNLFSRCFRGFSPEEVVAYIEELNKALKNANTQNEARVSELSAEIASLKKVDRDNKDLQGVLAEKDTEIASLQEEIQRLKADNQNLSEAIAAQGDKLGAVEEQNAKLQQDLAAADIQNKAMAENSKEYEAMLADVDNVLAEARRQAKDVIDKANTAAEDIMRKAELSAKENADALVAQSDEKVSENLKKVRYLYRRQEELSGIFKEHKKRVDDFFATLPPALDLRKDKKD